MVAEVNVADIAAAALEAVRKPPLPLPTGWILKESKSQPGYYYYYNQETGVSSWHPPSEAQEEEDEEEPNEVEDEPVPEKQKPQQPTPVESSSKRPVETLTTNDDPAPKRVKPSEVRVLHILKKHKDSRRPASWKNPNITITKQEATEELQGLMELLEEVKADREELRATVEELARTESDCSSAKRGGDLGFFGRKKMQPAFEEAAFDLEIGELSGIVETSSGVHVLLRVG